MDKPIRILHIVGAMYPGGMENFILNLYRNVDRSRLQFDIAVHSRKENDYCDLVESMGGHIYDLPRMSRHPIQNYRALKELVRTNGYKVVVRHTANAMILMQLVAAHRGGALTICHSHNETDPKKFLHKLCRPFLKKAADVKMACSQKAGAWMFGEEPFEEVHNAIDIDAFRFNRERRTALRAEFGIPENAHVYGNISNFIASKNHPFQIEVYKEILKRDPDSYFFCIGEGDLRPEIEAARDKAGLTKRLILTGIRRDVPDLMSMLDVLLFPSFFEGLPLTLIEAQAAGLPILMSGSITDSVIVTDGIVSKKSLSETAESWAEAAMERAAKETDRMGSKEQIASHGYDIKALAASYESRIFRMIKESDC